MTKKSETSSLSELFVKHFLHSWFSGHPERFLGFYKQNLFHEKETLKILRDHRLILPFQGFLDQNPRIQSLFSDEFLSETKNTYYQSAIQVATQEESLKELLDHLQMHQFQAVFLRGAVIRNVYYPDPCLRPSWDIDLLIQAHEFERFQSLVQEIGYSLRNHHGEYGFIREEPHPAHLDIHVGLWYTAKPKEIWNRRMNVSFQNQPLTTLSHEDHWIHLVTHSIFQHARLSLNDLIDMAFILQQYPEMIIAIHEESKQVGWFTKRAIAYTFKEIHDWIGISIPEPLLQKPMTPFFSFTLRPYDREHPGHLMKFLAYPNLWKFIGGFLSYLFPNSEFIQMRYGVKSKTQIFFWKIFRPFDLAVKSVKNILGFLLKKFQRLVPTSSFHD